MNTSENQTENNGMENQTNETVNTTQETANEVSTETTNETTAEAVIEGASEEAGSYLEAATGETEVSDENTEVATTENAVQLPADEMTTDVAVAETTEEAEEAVMISPWEDIAQTLKEMEATGNFGFKVIDYTPKTGVNSVETALRNQVTISTIHTLAGTEDDNSVPSDALPVKLRVDVLLVKKDNRSTIQFKLELAQKMWENLNNPAQFEIQNTITKSAQELRQSDNLNEVLIGYFGEGFRD